MDQSKHEGNVMDVDVDKVAKTFADLLKTPSLGLARYDESEYALNVYSEWSYDDISKKERMSYVKTFTILKSSLKSGDIVVIPSTPIPSDSKLTAFSKSGEKKAVLTNASGKNSGDDAEEHLQIFDQEKVLKTYDLKELDKHKGIYTSGAWGCTMAWSQDETKLAYLAERKIPKPTPFFTSYSKLGVDKNVDDTETKGKEKDKAEGKGQEFAFRQSWGEQLSTAIESVIVILDLEKDEFRVLSLPDKITPSDLQWVNSSSIIGTGYSHSDWKLGLIFCSNRESRIFQVEVETENFRYISEAGIAAFSPRVRPDSKFVVWQEREITGTHSSAAQVVGSNLENVQKKVLYSANPSSKVPLYDDFPQQCWTLDGTKLFTTTSNEVVNVLLSFTFDGEELKSVSEPEKNINGIRWIGENYILVSKSSCITPSSIALVDIRTNPLIIHQVSYPGDVLTEPMKHLVIPGSVSPASFYYGPAGENIKAKSVPLIVIPHGGPNSVYTDGFSPEGAFWLKLGFGILRINYVGSTGGTTDTSGNLLGKIGFDDVKDCQRILTSLLNTEPTINPDEVVVYGGSHGGFLGAHLSSSYPESYKAVALINPVTDLSTMVGTTDIPDWCLSQAGVKYDSINTVSPTVQSVENAAIFMACSPITHVEKVQAPTLLLLGSEDLRVPVSQGKAYYRALQIAKKKTEDEIRLYNDCHSLFKVPHRFDAWIQITLWFLRHLKKAV